MKSPEEKAKERIWRRRVEIDENGCWLWQGSINVRGYGKMKVDGGERSFLAHRVMAAVAFDFDLNSELCVLHRCDVRACVNPDHLYIGTKADNMMDRWYGHHR